MTESNALSPLVSQLANHVHWANYGVRRPIEVSTQGVDDFFSAATNFFGTMTPDYIKGLFSSTQRQINLLEKATYAQLRGKAIYVPPGFSGNFYDYSQLLADSSAYVADGLRVVKIIDHWLGSILNEPTHLANRNQMRFAYPDSKDLDMKLKTFFQKNETTTLPFGSVVMNIGQYRDTLLTMAEISERKTIQETNTLHKTMSTLVDHAKSVVALVEAPPEGIAVTAQTREKLSEVFREVDVFFSMAGVLLYGRKQFSVALQDNEDLFKKFIK